MEVAVVENVLKLNDELAALNRQRLKAAGVYTIDVIGAPGSGKTALIEATCRKLAGRLRVGVVVGDLATARDGQRLARFTDQVVQVNTGKTCHLEAHHVRQAIDRVKLDAIDVLFIENVGNLICPVGFDLGQDVKVGVFSISGGDDKAAKHPYAVKESAAVVLTKTDLIPYIPFDVELFRRDVRELNATAPLIELSVTSGQGLEKWTDWLLSACGK